MSPANGHADGAKSRRDVGAGQLVATSGAPAQSTAAPFASRRINDLVAELELPFDPAIFEWRVTNTTKNGKPRGQVIPYANPRAYTDCLNVLFTPAGWTRKYTVQMSPNFERSKEQKTVAKVFVTCELTIFGLGTHSATGKEWADDDNAGTSAEAIRQNLRKEAAHTLGGKSGCRKGVQPIPPFADADNVIWLEPRIARNRRILFIYALLRHPQRADGLLRDWRLAWLRTVETIPFV